MQSCPGIKPKQSIMGLKIPVLTPTRQYNDLDLLQQKQTQNKKQPSPVAVGSSQQKQSISRFEKQQIQYKQFCQEIQKQKFVVKRKMADIKCKDKQFIKIDTSRDALDRDKVSRQQLFSKKNQAVFTKNYNPNDTSEYFNRGTNNNQYFSQQFSNKLIKSETKRTNPQEQSQPIPKTIKMQSLLNIPNSITFSSCTLEPGAGKSSHKRFFSPKQPHSTANLISSSNMLHKRNTDDIISVHSATHLKGYKKLMSSAEISKKHCHTKGREKQVKLGNSGEFYLRKTDKQKQEKDQPTEKQKQSVRVKQKFKQRQKQALETISQTASMPNFLNHRKELSLRKQNQKNLNHSAIPHLLKTGSTVTLHSVSGNCEAPQFSFHILKQIADNVSATVYLVRQTSTNYLYCLKKCSVINLQPLQFDFLVRQGKYGNYIEHPYLLKTYCTLYDKQNIYQLMEYMQGSTLFQKSHNQRINIIRKKGKKKTEVNPQVQGNNKIESIKHILTSLLQALVYLHENKIVHRDIKPSNIFISHELTIKLGDFGSCGPVGSKEYVGTLDYVSPEVLLRKQYDQRIDLWAIGCIAYELWVGIPPFYHQLKSVTISNIVEKQFDKQKINNTELLDFLEELLEKYANNRVNAQEALHHPFLQDNECQTPTSPCSPSLNYYRLNTK